MFDVGFSEIFMLAVLGLLILGPERLPAVARALGAWVRRGRRMAAEFQRELEREVDLQSIRDIKQDLDDAAKPVREAARTLEAEHSLLEEKHSILNKTGLHPEKLVETDAPEQAVENESTAASSSTKPDSAEPSSSQ